MNYYLIIKNLYEDIKDNEFLLRDDGQGVYIEKWTYQGATAPSISYLESQEIAALQKQTLREEAITAKKYLDTTDWYIVRKNERNIDVPEDVTEIRISSIIKINEAKTQGIIII